MDLRLQRQKPISSWGHLSPAGGCLRGMGHGMGRGFDREAIGPSTYARKLVVKANARLGWHPM
jgi:hypothetical protein